MDIKLAEILDDENVHNNDGAHLDGGILDDKLWQERYKIIFVYHLSQYVLPNGPVGRLLVRMISDKIDEVLEWKCNMERVLCFMSMAL